MVRTANRAYSTFLTVGGVNCPYQSYEENLKGSYGRKNRNNVQHVKTSASPGHITFADPVSQAYLTSGLTRFNNETVQMIYSLYESEIDAIVYSYMNSVAKRLYPIDLSFNLINFFVEARELPSLADPGKAVHRNVRKLKSQARKGNRGKFRRPSRSETNQALNDVASTYVGSQFGLLPTISDMGEIEKRFHHLDSNWRNLRDRLKKSPIFRKKLDINLAPKLLRCRDLNLTPQAYYNAGEDSMIRVRVKKCTIVCSGRVIYDCPDLYTLGPLLAALDNGGLRLSLSTIWNATPFSWLVDWVLPIGDALSAMDKPWLDISCELKGQYSVKLELSVLYDPIGANNVGNGLPSDRSTGIADATLYNRFSLPPDLMAFKPPPLPSFKGTWNAKRAGILAGIAKGFKDL